MSIECGECEHDLRGGHDPSCSKYKMEPLKPNEHGMYVCPRCKATWDEEKYLRGHLEVCKVDNRQDPINPSHYKGRDVMDIINRYELSFCLGNVVKYVLRAKEKGGVEDLLKAKWYLIEEIRNEELKRRKPE